MPLLQEESVIYHHPLNDSTETTKPQAWGGDGVFAPAKVGNGLFGDTAGTGVTAASDNSFTTSSLIPPLEATPLNTSQVALSYRSGTTGKVMVLTVDGAGPTITEGPESDLNASAAISGPPSISTITTTKLIAAYFDGTDGVVQIGTRSGVNLTWSSKSVFRSGDVSDVVVAGLRDTKAIVAYVAGDDLPPVEYTESRDTIIPSVAGSWAEIDLSSFGIPANAVVEVLCFHFNQAGTRTVGVRKVGSSLERKIELRFIEAVTGTDGLESFVMHVQADADAKIEGFASSTSDVIFAIMGYWSNGTYVERMDSFTNSSDGTWETQNLSGFGVSANDVAEVVCTNLNLDNERTAGVREVGSGNARLFNLHEAEGGGQTAVTVFVNADNTANAAIEKNSQFAAAITFFHVGYWSDPPGDFNEIEQTIAAPSTANTWESQSLSGFGIPADSVAQAVVANQQVNVAMRMGVRETSSVLERNFEFQEPESGGATFGSMHVIVDGSAEIETFVENIIQLSAIRIVGYWTTSGGTTAPPTSGPGKLRAKAITITGITPTFGAEDVIDLGVFGDVGPVDMKAMTGGEALICYKQPQVSGSKGICRAIRVITLAGTTLTKSAELEFEDADITSSAIEVGWPFIHEEAEYLTNTTPSEIKSLVMWADSDGAGRSAILKYRGHQVSGGVTAIPVVDGDDLAGTGVLEDTFLDTATPPSAMAAAGIATIRRQGIVGFVDTADGNKGVIGGVLRAAGSPQGDTTYSDTGTFTGALNNAAGTVVISPLISPNLLINGGAEDGPVATGWTVTSGNPVRLVGVFADNSPFEGDLVFYANNTATAGFEQTVDLTAHGWTAGELDSGRVTAYVGGYQDSASQTPSDTGQLVFEYLDAADAVLATFTGPVVGARPRFELVSEQRILPSGTRKIKVTWSAIRNKGTSNDAWVDGIFVKLVNNTSLAIKSNAGASSSVSNQIAVLTKGAARTGSGYPTTVGSTKLAYMAWLKKPTSLDA